ncbi:MAG: hypothetical protein LDL33_13715 [Desulfomonile sp.]|nr:hypothetical protein [Desulfomonile sp.]
MNPESMTREELIQRVKEMNEFFDNVVVFWGDKRRLLDTFREVADNADGEYTPEEAANARIILDTPGAFESFIELTRDSFERGGISYVLSEKISALMEEVASRYRGN